MLRLVAFPTAKWAHNRNHKRPYTKMVPKKRTALKRSGLMCRDAGAAPGATFASLGIAVSRCARFFPSLHRLCTRRSCHSRSASRPPLLESIGLLALAGVLLPNVGFERRVHCVDWPSEARTGEDCPSLWISSASFFPRDLLPPSSAAWAAPACSRGEEVHSKRLYHCSWSGSCSCSCSCFCVCSG